MSVSSIDLTIRLECVKRAGRVASLLVSEAHNLVEQGGVFRLPNKPSPCSNAVAAAATGPGSFSSTNASRWASTETPCAAGCAASLASMSGFKVQVHSSFYDARQGTAMFVSALRFWGPRFRWSRPPHSATARFWVGRFIVSPDALTLSATGLPAGATAVFSPATIPAGVLLMIGTGWISAGAQQVETAPRTSTSKRIYRDRKNRTPAAKVGFGFAIYGTAEAVPFRD
jgi:hypothetical protein